MDKNAIKKYAVWARRELIERVSQRAMIYGITAKDAGDPNAESVNGHLLSQKEKRQRQALILNIKAKGYEQVMEEVAYTWFNRFAALRFMEVNGYLPSHIRVFTNDAGEFKPQILAEAIHLELDGLDMNKVYDLESANKNEELFKYLLIVQCNALNSILPGMFQKIDDYTELLLPDYLLREGSVIEQMVTVIPEEDWTDQVQIIGWLYQYYNTELKEKVFSRPSGTKICKEDVPAATQLFTPDWIVHYMVENSLGRLWLEGHPNDALRSEWKYYLDEAEQEPEVQAQLDNIRKEYAALKPEEICVIDPCMGSGHILCVLFDVLVRIYEDYGYTAREATAKIVENNLWGLDIDNRASQLAYFAVMMKARSYDRRFFTRGIRPNVCSIQESNNINPDYLELFGELKATARKLYDEFIDAKEYGSILNLKITADELAQLEEKCSEIIDENTVYDNIFDTIRQVGLRTDFVALIMQAKIMVQKYSVVCTNPPYMGGGYSPKLDAYIKKNYAYSKSDLFAVFIEKCGAFAKADGCYAMITQHAWMFLSSYEKLRKKLQNSTTVNMAHLGARAFDEISGEVVQTTAFVNMNHHIKDYSGTYARLIDGKSENEKNTMFLSGKYNYTANADNFPKIPGSPVAYWVSENFIRAFENDQLYQFSISPSQNITGNNNRFVRKHWELFSGKIDKKDEWIFYAKGGGYRKWWGNLDDVVNWTPTARYIYQHGDGKHASQIINKDYWYHKGITWGLITSNVPSFRIMPEGATYDKGGSTVIVNDDIYNFVLGLLNSKLYIKIATILNPTLNFQVKDIRSLPIKINRKNEIDLIVEENIQLSKADWDSFETSWDFKRHPFLNYIAESEEERTVACQYGTSAQTPIGYSYCMWMLDCEARFNKLKANEEELNRIFIDIYGLQDELTPEVEDKDVTVRKADLQRDIRSFISYAVGCMFGRYSLDTEGLAYAGGEWDASKYTQFLPDKDAIIPISDDEYFEDDIVGRFVKFVEVIYGKETLEENLRFIADALGGKGPSRKIIRNYFINGFYADHLKVYQKRPIYWLFDSGKKNSFKCLIYMHRYQPDTIARIRTDYIHEQQSRYRTAIADLKQRINGASTSEKVKLSKQLTTLQAQADEIRVYEEKIHHLADRMIRIDLDDGVKHNYEIFKDVLAKIK